MGYQKIIVNGREVVDFSQNPTTPFDVVTGKTFYDTKGSQLNGKLEYRGIFEGSNIEGWTEYYIPDGVKMLYRVPGPFNSDSDVETVYIPASIESVSNESAFSNFPVGSNFKSVRFGDLYKYLSVLPEHNSSYSGGYYSPMSNLYSSDNYIQIYNNNQLVNDLVIPEKCTHLGYRFFCRTRLPRVTLSSKLKAVNYEYPFSEAKIYTLIIPENFEGSLASDAFNYAQVNEVYNLSNYDISNIFSDTTIIHTSMEEESAIIYEGPYVLLSYDNRKVLIDIIGDIENGELIIPNGVTHIADYLFRHNSSVRRVVFSDSVVSIGEYAFENCINLAEIILPQGLTSLGTACFQNCPLLQTVYYNGDIANWCGITFGTGWYDSSPCYNFKEEGKIYFNGELLTELNIPDEITTIPNSAFAFMQQFRVINLNNVTTIDSYAFYNNKFLDCIVLPETLTIINNNAFSGCKKLVEVYNLTNLSLTIGQTTNGYVAYYAKVIHTSLNVDSARFNLNDCDFITDSDNIVWLYNCNSQAAELTLPTLENSKTYKLCVDALAKQGANVENLIIPTCVIEFAAQSYTSWKKLKKVEYLGTLSQWCNITFPNNSSNPLYGFRYSNNKHEAQFWCNGENMANLIIPDTITSIPNYVFVCCPMETLNLNKVRTIGEYSFAYCEKLRDINFGQGAQLTTDSYSFTGNTALENLIIPNNVSYLDFYCFSDCTALRSVQMEGTNKITFFSYVFSNCKALETVVFRTGATQVSYYMFQNCTSLTNVTLVEGITLISEGGFYGCKKLDNLTIPSTVTEIKSSALGSNENLSLKMLSATPCTLANSNVVRYAKEIIVPKGSLSAYQSATNWSTYASKIKEEI